MPPEEVAERKSRNRWPLVTVGGVMILAVCVGAGIVLRTPEQAGPVASADPNSGRNNNSLPSTEPVGQDAKLKSGPDSVVQKAKESEQPKNQKGKAESTDPNTTPDSGFAASHVLKGHTKAVMSVAFSKDGRILASGSHDGTIKLWDVTKGEELSTFQRSKMPVRAVAFSQDGVHLATGGDDENIQIWNVNTSKLIAEIRALDNVCSLAYDKTGERLAVGSAGPRKDTGVVYFGNQPPLPGIVKLWNTKTTKLVTTLEGHSHAVRALAFTTDGSMLVSGSGFHYGSEGGCYLWDLATNKHLLAYDNSPGSVWAVAVSPDGTMTAAGGGGDNSGPIKLWGLRSGKALTKLSGHPKRVNALAFTPDSKFLVSGSDDQTLRLWNTTTGEEEVNRKYHSGPIYCIAVAPDGRLIASGAGDGLIVLMKRPIQK